MMVMDCHLVSHINKWKLRQMMNSNLMIQTKIKRMINLENTVKRGAIQQLQRLSKIRLEAFKGGQIRKKGPGKQFDLKKAV